MIRKLSIILLAAFCVSCQTVVEIDVPHKENQLALNSFFHPDSTFGISLTQSQFVLERGDFKIVTGATAILMDEEGNEIGQLNDQGTGIYTSDITPQPGESYRIKVSKKPFATVTATGSIPEDSARMTKHEVKRRGNNFNQVTISIWLDDPPGEDYYGLSAMNKYTFYGEERDTATYEHGIYLNSEDPVFGDQDNRQRLIFDDVLFDGKTKRIDLNASVGSPQCGPQSDHCNQKVEVTLYIRKLSKEYYQYRETEMLQDQLSENPFAEPVPVFENIENGLGIFAGFRESVYPIEIPEYQDN